MYHVERCSKVNCVQYVLPLIGFRLCMRCTVCQYVRLYSGNIQSLFGSNKILYKSTNKLPRGYSRYCFVVEGSEELKRYFTVFHQNFTPTEDS